MNIGGNKTSDFCMAEDLSPVVIQSNTYCCYDLLVLLLSQKRFSPKNSSDVV